MKTALISSLVMAFILFCFGAEAQGPWAQGKGHGYTQLVYNTIPTYSGIFNGDGIRTTDREISETVFSLYGEEGISDRITIGANIPFVMVETGAPSSPSREPLYASDKLSNLGNVSAFGKYSFSHNALKMAFITQVEFPTSTRNTETGVSTGVNAYSIQPRLSIGGSSSKWYYFGYFGYGYRTNNHHDQLNMAVEAGRRVANDKIILILNIHRTHNLANGSNLVDSPANIETGLYTSFQEYSAFLFKIFADNIKNGFGAFASLGGSFPGELVSVAASPAMSLGIFYKR